MNRPESLVYEFSGFRVDARRRVLARADGKPVKLKAKVFDLLLYLVEHAGEPLDKGTLMAAVWPGLVVEENNLNKTISVLRRILGEAPGEHRFIVTEPGRGYRFVAEVTSVQMPAADSHVLDEAPRAVGTTRWRGLHYAVTGLLAVAVVLLVVANYGPRGEAERLPTTRFEIATSKTMNPLNIALSRDGRQIAYVGATESGTAIWVRSLDSSEARPVPGTEGVTESAYPFWSYDGTHLAFRDKTGLRRVAVETGETKMVAADVSVFRRGAWGSDDTILFGATVLYRVPASGGQPVAVTELDESLGEIVHSAPSFLPDGRHFLYKATNVNRRNGAIYIGSLDPAEPRKKLLEASRAIYVEPGFILYARAEALYAQAFDRDSLELTGEAVRIADDVVYRDVLDTSAFEAADGGVLIFRREEPPGPQIPLVWVDRLGVTTPAGVTVPPVYFNLSPDGSRIAFGDGNPPDIWVLDMERGSRTRLTTDPEVDRGPVWSPDGVAVAFDSHRQGSRKLFQRRADAAVPEQLLLDAGAHDVIAMDWSAGHIVFERDTCVGCAFDIWALPVGGEPFAYTESPFDERLPALSPDGRWIAYCTSESGVYEVVVQSFPDPALGKWQISANGGSAPHWARGGTELYYYDATGSIVRVEIATEPHFRIGKSVRVTEAPSAYRWDVTVDGGRLLKIAPAGSEGRDPNTFPITVILNWTALLGI